MPDGVRVLAREPRSRRSAPRAPLAAYADTAADDPAFLIYTSGTSRQPKGVLHAHRSAWGRRPTYDGWSGIGADDVMLHAGAFNWSYTLCAGLADPWANGATAVLYHGRREAGVWAKLIAGDRRNAVRRRARRLSPDPQAGRPCPDRHRRGSATGWWRARRCRRRCSPTWQAATGLAALRGLRHERMLDLRLQPPRHAGPARQPGPAAGRAGAIAALPVDGGSEPVAGGRARACSPSTAPTPA